MNVQESEKISEMATRLIAFINWKGADFESKRKKVLYELFQIKEYCRKHVDCYGKEVNDGKAKG